MKPRAWHWTGLVLCITPLVFLALKLTGVVSWSWLWVLSPVWIPITVFVVVAILMVAIDFTRGFGDAGQPDDEINRHDDGGQS